jgi:NADH dehydrogenase [ubiquinone] 1 alpha subcomplex assembly factor 5
MSDQIHIFDRALARRHRDRAAEGFSAHHHALLEEAATHILERLADVKRRFSSILDLGAHDGLLARRLAQRKDAFVIAADLSEKLLGQGGYPLCVAADEEFLPFAAESFDLIVSNLSLHWVNDLPGALAQINMALKPDGLFLATLLGGSTLHELRACLLEAELAITGGISPRLSPSIDMQTASALLQRAGFSLPVTDQEVISFTYSDIFALMRDLRGMGETNAQRQRLRKGARREVFEMANRLYRERFALADGRFPATFEVVFLHGWKPGLSGTHS